ncbi:MAG: hypothetical protein AAF556_11315, partial [Pseudomonadota bacterium]
APLNGQETRANRRADRFRVQRSATRAATYNIATAAAKPGRHQPSGELIPSGVRRQIKLGSGPTYVKERAMAQQITGHAPGSRMPNGATYFASGPQAAAEVPVPEQTATPQQPHQPH